VAPANPQDEQAPHRPDSPYAESKSRAHTSTVAARDAGFFACVGILYTHESPVRDAHFVTRKITRAAAEIAAGQRDVLELGNLEIARDWGAAREYVVAMHAALAEDEPGDYIIATGRTHSLRDLVDVAFASAGIADGWSHVRQDPELMRPSDALARVGDPSKARDVLGWEAAVPFDELVREMVEVDQRRLATGVEESPDYLR
jgi:GDPmannose 4,6-dehydratase